MIVIHVTVGILLTIAIALFLVYAYLAVRHATRFRYLSRRMLLLTLIFLGSSVVFLLGIIVSYGFFIFS